MTRRTPSRKDRRAARRKGARPDRTTRSRLFEGEDVVMIARPGRLASLPKYVLTLGLYGLWRKRDTSVLTNQRVLFGKGIVRRTEKSIPLSHVDDVSFVRSGLNSYSELTVKGRERDQIRRVGPMAPPAAHRFTREILRRL